MLHFDQKYSKRVLVWIITIKRITFLFVLCFNLFSCDGKTESIFRINNEVYTVTFDLMWPAY